jgi:hypothetical protein
MHQLRGRRFKVVERAVVVADQKVIRYRNKLKDQSSRSSLPVDGNNINLDLTSTVLNIGSSDIQNIFSPQPTPLH